MSNIASKNAGPRSLQALNCTVANLVGGRDKAALMAEVDKATYDKVCTERDLTVRAVKNLITAAGKLAFHGELQDIIDEYSSHFVPTDRRVVRELTLVRLKQCVDAILNGENLEPMTQTASCLNGHPMQLVCLECLRGKRF